MQASEWVTPRADGAFEYHAEVKAGKVTCGYMRRTEVDPSTDADELFHMREWAQWYFEENAEHVGSLFDDKGQPLLEADGTPLLKFVGL